MFPGGSFRKAGLTFASGTQILAKALLQLLTRCWRVMAAAGGAATSLWSIVALQLSAEVSLSVDGCSPVGDGGDLRARV